MNNIAEYVLCRDNIFYFMEKYLKLEFRGYQIDILARYEDPNRPFILNILGHRGFGISTLNAIYLLWRVMFYPNEKLLLVVPNSSTIKEEQELIMRLYSTVTSLWPDDSVRYKVNVTSMGRIIFNNDSMIKIVTYSPDRVRGWNFDTIIMDSTGTMGYNFFNNVIANGKKFIFTNSSVPESEELDNMGDCHKYPWYCNDDRTLDWYIQMLNSLGKPEFNRSYGSNRGFSDDQRRL